MKNKIDNLRTHLFDALEQLLDEEKPMETARAEAIAHVGQTIINSVKMEWQIRQKMNLPDNEFFTAETKLITHDID